MTTGTVQNIRVPFGLPFIDDLKKNWGWFLALGIVTIIFGIMAISIPLGTAIAINLFVGWLLVFGGVAQTVRAIKCRRRNGFLAALLGGLLTLIAGVILLVNPVRGVMALTLILGCFFGATGVVKVVESFQLKPLQGWGWLCFTGVVECLFGILIWVQWPSSAAWVIGLLVGIDLMFVGWSMVALSLVSRRFKAVEDKA